MDKNRMVGSAKQIKGSIKEAVGKVVGDAKVRIPSKKIAMHPQSLEVFCAQS